ncbi:MAG: DNA-directed RNA polymerase subunit alpha C-terminal domain-containing protein [Chloroflexota bacterium]
MKRLGRFGEHQTQATQRQEAQKSKAEQRFLKQQLVALDLSDRVYQILSESNFISVGDVATKLEEDKNALLDLDGFGPKALEEVEAKLTEARSTYFVEAA